MQSSQEMPQSDECEVHCRYGNYESFGDGDLKEEGVKRFFLSHRCNHICKKLKLRPQVDQYFDITD